MAPFVASVQSQEITDDCIDMVCLHSSFLNSRFFCCVEQYFDSCYPRFALVKFRTIHLFPTCIVDPGSYRQLEEHLREHTRGKALIDIVAIKNIAEGDQAI
eukprot:m.382551 g.382551  ORF g.382551 m.382551 type:complete len:101 (+) comp56250_c0_seq3:2-304(+)